MSQYNELVSSHDELAEFFNTRHLQLQKYLFWHVRSYDIAEELAQETYLRFLKHSGELKILDLNAFLFTIAANLARDHLRSVKRKQRYSFIGLEAELVDSKPNAEEIITRQCLEKQLQQAIESLPEKTKEVFLLYRAEELSYKQIAVQLSISERTVEYHLRQALLHCRRCLINQELV
ncbi:MAG: RNA polymerase sigma factor [Methylococcales bacterium]